MSTRARLVSGGMAALGTLSLTATELYFEVDEEEPDYKKIDPEVSASVVQKIHGCRAVRSFPLRTLKDRYLRVYLVLDAGNTNIACCKFVVVKISRYKKIIMI